MVSVYTDGGRLRARATIGAFFFYADCFPIAVVKTQSVTSPTIRIYPIPIVITPSRAPISRTSFGQYASAGRGRTFFRRRTGNTCSSAPATIVIESITSLIRAAGKYTLTIVVTNHVTAVGWTRRLNEYASCFDVRARSLAAVLIDTRSLLAIVWFARIVIIGKTIGIRAPGKSTHTLIVTPSRQARMFRARFVEKYALTLDAPCSFTVGSEFGAVFGFPDKAAGAAPKKNVAVAAVF